MVRKRSLDFLKALSIVAVVLYHLGILKNGYLGVEVFFVVSGYGFAKISKSNSLKDDVVKPIVLMLRKQYYAIVLVCFLLLAVGFFFVFPIYYKSFGYESLAALLLSSNILSVLKATDYWSVSNMTNPFMHMWYICVLIKSLALLRVLLWLTGKLRKNVKPIVVYLILFIVSLTIYLIPSIPATYKFYLVPFRLYEILIGCLLYEVEKRKQQMQNMRYSMALLAAITVLLILGNFVEVNKTVLMFLVMLLSCAYIYCDKTEYDTNKTSITNVICFIGRFSYQIYLWHQAVIALALLLVFEEVNAACVLVVLIATAAMTAFTISLSKCKVTNRLKNSFFASVLVIAITFSFAGVTYLKKGAYFRYHELGLSDINEDPDRWITYVDRVYSWEKDFEEGDKLKVLIIGNSFGRDFANVLSESSVADLLDISYIPVIGNEADEKWHDKIEAADIVFYSVPNWIVPEVLIEECYDKLVIVGNKCFSESSKIWLKRFSKDYLKSTVQVPAEFLEKNNEMKRKHGIHYLDMMSYVLNDKNLERVFTDDGSFISVDGIHLSPEGAVYFAEAINIKDVFLNLGLVIED